MLASFGLVNGDDLIARIGLRGSNTLITPSLPGSRREGATALAALVNGALKQWWTQTPAPDAQWTNPFALLTELIPTGAPTADIHDVEGRAVLELVLPGAPLRDHLPFSAAGFDRIGPGWRSNLQTLVDHFHQEPAR